MSESVAGSDLREGYKTVKIGPREIAIPSEWQDVSFAEAIEVNPRYSKPDSGIFDFLPMDAIDEEKQTIEYWNRRQKEDCTTTWFKNGDTVYAKITPCTENGKITFIEGMNTELGSGSTEFLVFHPREGITDDRFAYYLSNLPEFRSVTISLMEGSTGRQRVPSDVFHGGIHVPLPPLPEQRRIADILSTVDEHIQQTDDVIETTKELKRGLMQDLFRPSVSNGQSTKLGDVPSGWKIGQLREFGVSFISGGTPSREHPEYFGGETPWLKTSEVQNCRVRSAEEYITDAGLEESSATVVSPGSVLVAMYGGGTVGNVGLLEMEAATNQACCAVNTEDSDLNNEFLYYQLLYEHRRLVSYAAGSSQQNLSKHDVEQFDILVPPKAKQRRIAEVLRETDNKLELEREHKHHLQELKHGLMQDLLTGKVRVDPDS